jgi:hypothetical protein
MEGVDGMFILKIWVLWALTGINWLIRLSSGRVHLTLYVKTFLTI